MMYEEEGGREGRRRRQKGTKLYNKCVAALLAT